MVTTVWKLSLFEIEMEGGIAWFNTWAEAIAYADSQHTDCRINWWNDAGQYHSVNYFPA